MLSKTNRSALVGWMFPVCTAIWSLGAECHPKEEFKPDYEVYMCMKSHVHIYYGSKFLLQRLEHSTKYSQPQRGNILSDLVV